MSEIEEVDWAYILFTTKSTYESSNDFNANICDISSIWSMDDEEEETIFAPTKFVLESSSKHVFEPVGFNQQKQKVVKSH